jgi:hypothetical protein
MATVTYPFCEMGGGIVRVEFDVNTANWRMTQIRCINNSNQDATAIVYETGVQVFEAVGLANGTTSWNTGGLQIAWDEIDGGLMLGNYELAASWPT